jgi:hypothetical protein
MWTYEGGTHRYGEYHTLRSVIDCCLHRAVKLRFRMRWVMRHLLKICCVVHTGTPNVQKLKYMCTKRAFRQMVQLFVNDLFERIWGKAVVTYFRWPCQNLLDYCDQEMPDDGDF